MSKSLLILTWHSNRVLGNEYPDNDLVAFSHDLRALDQLGWTILPLETALDGLTTGCLPDRPVVLTADDGALLDFGSFEHPTWGTQAGLLMRLQELLAKGLIDRRHQPVISSFVIASPAARVEMDEKITGGLNLLPDDWWAAANQSGLMQIENHSWDHNHSVLEHSAQKDNIRGNFFSIDTERECRVEIDQASILIERISGRRPRFFAYPYGEASSYVRDEYLPRFAPALGLRAAFSTEPAMATRASNTWHLPRFVAARDWTSPEEFRSLLAAL